MIKKHKLLEPVTLILDIDGTLLEHMGDQTCQIKSKPSPLKGVLDKLNEWERKGYKIILLTGRRESCRKVTEKQLSNAGIYYDQLVMGVCRGTRILINDKKPNDPDIKVAIGIEVERNQGLTNLDI